MRLAIVGVGNCSCALVQALDAIALDELLHVDLAPGLSSIDPSTIQIVAAFDIDSRKIGRPLNEAIFAQPNCTTRYRTPQYTDVIVSVGATCDSADGPPSQAVEVSDETARTTAEGIVAVLTDANAEIVLLYLPVGLQHAAEFYTSCALTAGCSVVNCTPAVIANSPAWRAKFIDAGLVLVGDDMKSNVGSTTIHQTLLALLRERGVDITSSYQLNVGGNADFLNMRDPSRAAAKRITKTAALDNLVGPKTMLSVGPSDYIPQLKDHKVGYIRFEGTGYLGMPFSLELRLEVEDSPNAAPVAIDAIRLAAAIKSGADVKEEDAMACLFKAPGVSRG